MFPSAWFFRSETERTYTIKLIIGRQVIIFCLREGEGEGEITWFTGEIVRESSRRQRLHFESLLSVNPEFVELDRNRFAKCWWPSSLQYKYNHDHSHYREIFLARVLISFVFNNRISSFHIVWFSLINICVVTKQMRGKNTSLMASHESNASLFPIKIRRFLMSVTI